MIRRLNEIERIEIETQEPGVRIIDKQGPLHNPADRDHCLQYMVAIALLFGALAADHYEDDIGADPRVDALRGKMHVQENAGYTRDYYDPDKRSIPNSIQLFFSDNSSTHKVEVHYPIGHRLRRQEGIPLLKDKFADNLLTRFAPSRCQEIQQVFADTSFERMPVNEFLDCLRLDASV